MVENVMKGWVERSLRVSGNAIGRSPVDTGQCLNSQRDERWASFIV